MHTLVLTTGGTIGGVHLHGERRCAPKTSPVLGMLPQAILGRHVAIEEILAKWSPDLTLEDFGLIFERIKISPETRIIVTVGTHAMCKTARYLLDRIVHPIAEQSGDAANKTVVLTGAMRKEEGPFELGFALAAVQLLPPGIYVAVQGNVYHGEQVRKDEHATPPCFVGQALTFSDL